MIKQITLGKAGHEYLRLGQGLRPIVIAEAGVLTWGEVGRGKRFVDEAKKAGIKLLKFQAFNADHVVSKRDEFWHARLKQRELGKEAFFEIQKYAKSKGIIAFATTHNEHDMIDFSNSGMEILKIGSGDSNNYRMIDMALDTGKPVIVSLGLMDEKESHDFLKKYRSKARQLIVMHCVTLYPAPPESIGLKIIDGWKKKFPEYVFGYSDHTIGGAVSLASVARGNVSLIEKHICLEEDRIRPKFESLDIIVAMTPNEMSTFVKDIHSIYSAIGNRNSQEIKKNLSWARKGVVARNVIKRGTTITDEMLSSRRPFDPNTDEVPIDSISKIIGKKVLRDIDEGAFIRFVDINFSRKKII